MSLKEKEKLSHGYVCAMVFLLGPDVDVPSLLEYVRKTVLIEGFSRGEEIS